MVPGAKETLRGDEGLMELGYEWSACAPCQIFRKQESLESGGFQDSAGYPSDVAFACKLAHDYGVMILPGCYWLIPDGNTPDVARQDREADLAVGLLPLQTGGTHSLVGCRYSSGKSTRRLLDLENLCKLFLRTDQRGR